MFDSEPAELAAREEPIQALEREVAQLAGVVNAAQGRLVQLVARALAEGLWIQAGIHSPTQWLIWQLGITTRRAREILRLATRASELPATVAAVTRGALSLDQAVVVARHVPADHEESAAALAAECTVQQLERVLRRYSYEPDPVPDPVPEARPDPDEPERRSVSFGATEDGRWRLHADLPLDEGAVVECALTNAHRELFDAAESPEGRRAVTWADALLAMAEASLVSGEVRLPGPSRFLVHAHLEADAVDGSTAPTASLHLGHRLPDALRRLLTCAGSVRPVHEQQGRPVNVGRKLRIVPSRTRRLVEHRDGGCVVPGCGTTRNLQVHHIVHHEDGGTTDTSNLLTLCRRHHRLHHLGALRIEGDADRPRGDPDGVRFADARGRPIDPAARPCPPGELPATDAYRHPSGGPLDPYAVTLSRNRSDAA
ncbi:MAG: DUF222 domain-containing protein [Acidimicrobiia bacterium]